MGLKCAVCGGESFHSRYAQLNTPLATFFGFDFMNESAKLKVCGDCGFVHWFLPPRPVDPMATDGGCLRCDEPLDPALEHCSKCGWSWRWTDESNDQNSSP